MKKSTWLKLCLPVFICCSLWNLTLPHAYGTDKADDKTDKDKREIVKRARQGYYSLRKLGLVEFESKITPTWEVTLKEQIKSDPANAQTGLKLLNSIHFAMSLDADGSVKVTHQLDVTPPNQQTVDGLNQIYGGMQQSVSGFFASWSPFMLTSPFPEVESEYAFEEIGGGYRLSYKEGTADIVTSLTKDLEVTEIKVSTSEFTSSIRPTLTRTQQGFILSGYEANYKPVSGPGTTELKTQIDYQEVNGLQLPHKLNLESVYDGTPTQMELVFTDYNVKHK